MNNQGVQITGDLQLRTFMSKKNPTPSQAVKFDAEINKFLKTMTNNPAEHKDKPRLLKMANTSVSGGRLIASVWYIDLMGKPKDVTIIE